MSSYSLAATALIGLVIIYTIRLALRKKDGALLRSAVILVLGDIGRSPRMMYHAESFAEANFSTYIIGYSGSKPIPSLGRLNVRFIHLAELPKEARKLPFLVLAPLKVAVQVIAILHALLVAVPHPPEYIMVQNPPSIPTLALVQLVCKLSGAKLIIDWHNLGYSILALRLGNNHIIVKFAAMFEHYFGKTAYLHLFVTKAMRDFLSKEWDLQGTKVILHDRPPSQFKRTEIFEIHDLFSKITRSFATPSVQKFLPNYVLPESTPFTKLIPPGTTPEDVALDMEIMSDSFISVSSLSATRPILRTDRPALVVSSTSWTPDEDFSILLNALSQYEEEAKGRNDTGRSSKEKLPKILAIVTGKGPLKQAYMGKIARRQREEDWKWVRCCSIWLEPEDYPVLLGSSDLGISLHSSSSALDLPMKVVDMFGCGLPVCALDFKCLPELVKEGENGLVFRGADDLAQQLVRLLLGFPAASGLEDLRGRFRRAMKPPSGSPSYSNLGHTLEHSEEPQWCSWSENWNRVMRPHLLKDSEHFRYD